MEPLALAMILGPLGTTEIVVIVLVLLLLFGGKKIPELARGLGKGITEFKNGLHSSDGQKDSQREVSPPRIDSADSSDSNQDSPSNKR